MAIYTGSSKHLGGTEVVSKKETFYYGLIQKNVLVSGANGQLGQEIKRLSQKQNTPFRFIYTDIEQLDITKRDEVINFVSGN